MSDAESTKVLKFKRVGAPGVHVYDVNMDDVYICRVQRAQLGAGQFGTHWQADAMSGHRSSNFRSREAAARWLASRALS